jgi:hypothetical protein
MAFLLGLADGFWPGLKGGFCLGQWLLAGYGSWHGLADGFRLGFGDGF